MLLYTAETRSVYWRTQYFFLVADVITYVNTAMIYHKQFYVLHVRALNLE